MSNVADFIMQFKHCRFTIFILVLILNVVAAVSTLRRVRVMYWSDGLSGASGPVWVQVL